MNRIVNIAIIGLGQVGIYLYNELRLKKKEYLMSQIGNPEGDENPNKKFYDPRAWLREGEKTFKARLIKAFEDLNNINTLD